MKPNGAKSFYKDTLGLMLLSEDECALEFRANGILLRVYPRFLDQKPYALNYDASRVVF